MAKGVSDMDFFERMKQAHLDEPCPKCKQRDGARCVTASGKVLQKPHSDRIHNGTLLYIERLESGYYDAHEEEQGRET